MAKKPASAATVSVLVALIALFMILYILLLPPAERAQLLDIPPPEEAGKEIVKADGKVLAKQKAETILSEKPGEVSLDIEDENLHNLNSVSLFVKSEAETIDLVNTISISRSSFSNKFQEVEFKLDDLNEIEELNLIFFAEEAKGKLFIDLNGNNVFNIVIDEGKLRSVKLPLRFLKQDNTIKFYAESPGFIFISNRYDLSDVSLRKQFKLTNIKSKRKVSLSRTEIDNLDKATLEYVLYCEEIGKREGRLKIIANDFLLYSDLVRCGQGFSKIEVDEEFLNEGDNDFEFSIDKGDYTLEQLKLVTKLRGGALLTYKFFLEDEEFDNVWDGRTEAKLKLIFGSDGEKSARFEINGESVRMKTDDNDFIRDISGLVKEGNNVIKIIPDDDFVIDLMEIVLE